MQAVSALTAAGCDEFSHMFVAQRSPVQAHSMNTIDDRAAELSKAIRAATDSKVFSGPFKDMVLPEINGLGSPYYLGTYEHELHHVINHILSQPYDSILNVGCSFGYYAVGLGRLMPKAKITAADIDGEALVACEKMAQANDVHNITFVNGGVGHFDLTICDIEGAEEDYIFGDGDILVECHECIKPGIVQKLIDRFAPTHNIDIIHNQSAFFNLEQLFPGSYIEHFDHAIATWEGRAGPTPWLFMKRKDEKPTDQA